MHTPNILITGGAGFVGSRLIQELLEAPSRLFSGPIRVLDIEPEPPVEHPRVHYTVGDIRNYACLAAQCEGVDLVFHMASLVDWGTHGEEEVYSINVDGTRNVIAACREKQVKALVYTSSLDAIFSGKPTRDVDESIAYPARYPNIYCESKAEAEKLVCAANGEQLQTVCLRPADIFGEGDPFHIGSLIAMARKGFYVRIGDGTAKNQHVYVGNVAHAHIQAADAIMNGNKAPCGNVYFITDAPPSNFFSFFDYIIEQAGYRIRPGNVWIPRWLMYCIGSLVEFIAFLLRPFHRFNPKVSRFAVTYTCTDFTFSSEQARKDFHFLPKYSHQEALERTITYYAATRDS